MNIKQRILFLLGRYDLENMYMIMCQNTVKTLLDEIRLKDPRRLEISGYNVYSQNDEDGIIQEIFKRIGTTNKFFVEIGVGNGLENNTYFLLFKDWKGAWIEGFPKHAKFIRNSFNEQIAQKRLSLTEQYVDKDNIQNLLKDFPLNMDLFCIDIDGNDFYVLESALTVIKPRVICAEYNSKFPADVDWCMKYDSKHRWKGSDKHGVALKTLTEMLQKKGYSLVGTTITGINAFYVQNELINNLFTSVNDISTLYNPPRFNLQFRSGHPAKEPIC